MGLSGAVLLLLAGALASSSRLEKYYPERNINCTQGLSRCRVKEEMFPMKPPESGPVKVSGVNVKALLCCNKSMKCRACVQIRIRLQILDAEGGSEGGSGEDDGEHDAAITVRYYSAPNLPQYQTISFTVTPAARKHHRHEVMVLEYKGVFLGSRVNITINSFNQSVTFPHCSKVVHYGDIRGGVTPKVSLGIDRQRGVWKVAGGDKGQQLQICVKRGQEGTCWPSPTTIPLHAVTPCLCFQAWTEGSCVRSLFCPFTNKTEFRENIMRNVSLSVRHTTTYEASPVLSWILSAPCRLEATVWLCRMGAESGTGCAVVPGFQDHLNESSRWMENSTTLWTAGEFVDFSPDKHLLHCVMFKVNGQVFGPQCQHDTFRRRWTVPVLVVLLGLVLLGVGVRLLRKTLKGCLSNWVKTHHSGEGRGDVLLLHDSGSDVSEAGQVCRLGVQLSELGFGVCLNLWSQDALCSVGPVPWLHSKLPQLEKHGGKALLVLSDSTLDAAQACWDSWNREAAGAREQEPSTDISGVLRSALWSVFSAHLKGNAAKCFALVHFDSQTRTKERRITPDLFRGLKLYSLPSDSRLLLADLCPKRPKGLNGQLKRLLWLRRASQRLAQGLSSSGESSLTRVVTLEEETLPLNL